MNLITRSYTLGVISLRHTARLYDKIACGDDSAPN